MSPADLRALIASTGISAQAFARDVVGRDPRTVRRWLSGEAEIPDAASRWLERLGSVRRSTTAITIRVRSAREGPGDE